MRRVDKEKLKLFTKLGLIDSFNNLKQCNPKDILYEFDQCKKTQFYVNGSEKVRAIIRTYYGMALKHTYGRLQASKVR